MKNKIPGICKKILTITDDEIAQLEQVADHQRNYFSPLKNATMAKQRALGEYNEKVIRELVSLLETLKKGPCI